LIHNTAYRSLGINAVYLPFRVPRGDLPGFIKDFGTIPVQGYSVTIPHKEAAAALANDRDESVAMTGAANTLVHNVDGFKAFNTDYQPPLDSLIAHMPTGPDGMPVALGSRAVLLLGAGGVARAVAQALQRSGALLTIANRTGERAHKLAEEVGCRTVDWGA